MDSPKRSSLAKCLEEMRAQASRNTERSGGSFSAKALWLEHGSEFTKEASAAGGEQSGEKERQ